MTDLSQGSSVLSTTTFLETPSGSSKPCYSPFYYWRTTGTSTPGFYAKKRAKALLPINMFHQHEARSTFQGGLTYSGWTAQFGGTLKYRLSQSEPQPSNWSVLTPEDYLIMSEARLQAKINPDLLDSLTTRAIVGCTASKHDSLTFIAEFSKTVTMFKKAGANLARLLTSTSPKHWADAWLEGRYGWRTLWYDMQSLNEAIKSMESTSDFYKHRATSAFIEDDDLDWDYTRLNATYEIQSRIIWDISYRGFAVAKFKPPPFGGDVLTTAWELMPWSFVIDWFFDVGSKIAFLSSRWAKADYVSGYGAYVRGSGSVYHSHVETGDRVNLGSSTWFDMESFDSEVDLEGELRLRAPLTPDLLPSLNIRLDDFKVLDLVAMLSQLLRKR